jgi:hypothetical protein
MIFLAKKLAAFKGNGAPAASLVAEQLFLIGAVA